MRSEPDAMPEIQRLVDDAVVAVTIVVDAKGSDDATPSPLIVVVALRPTYKVSSTEKSDVDAFVRASREGSESVGFPETPSPFVTVI